MLCDVGLGALEELCGVDPSVEPLVVITVVNQVTLSGGVGLEYFGIVDVGTIASEDELVCAKRDHGRRQVMCDVLVNSSKPISLSDQAATNSAGPVATTPADHQRRRRLSWWAGSHALQPAAAPPPATALEYES